MTVANDMAPLIGSQSGSPTEVRRGDNSKAGRALDVVYQLQQDFKRRDDLYREIDACIYLERAVEIPPAFKKTAIEVRSPLASHISLSVTAALSVNAPRVTFDPVGIGEAAEENAAKRGEFFMSSWQRQEAEARLRVFRRFMHSVVTKGEGTIKTVEQKNRAWSGYNSFSKKLRTALDEEGLDGDSRDRVYDRKTEEFKRAAPYPIRSIDVIPESFYYIKGEDGFTFASEVKAVPYYDTLLKYKAGVDAKGRVTTEGMGLPISEWARVFSPGQSLNMVEVWDLDQVMYILQGPGDVTSDKKQGGLVVKTLRHRYGDKDLRVLRGPYFHSHGITTSSRQIEKQGLSVLFGYLHLFPLLDALLTIQSQAAYMFGFPAFKKVRPDGLGPLESPFGTDALEGVTAQEESAKITPGHIYPDNIEPVNMPHGGIDLDKTIAMVRNLLELALPSVAQGLMEGDNSGYAINQAAHLARLAWDPIVDNVEFALAERVGFESWLIENAIKERVHVWGESPKARTGKARTSQDKGWLSLGPKDINGIHRYKVELEPETPSNLTIELRTHQQMLEMRAETPDQMVRALGNNPAEVRRGWMFYELINDPQIKDRVKKGVFQRLATVEQKKMQDARGATPGAAPAAATAPAQGGPPPPEAAPQGLPPAPPGPGMPQYQQAPSSFGNRPRGTPAGAPGGIPNPPQGHQPLPGGG